MFLLCLLFLLPDQGRKIQAHAESDSDVPVDLPKVEEKIGAVPSGLSTDSDVTKREAESISRRSLRANAEKFEFQAEEFCLLWTVASKSMLCAVSVPKNN
ncbi:unnamed protein product [Fraxinus pennsylvanica]|uniref:Uncharacterized protein n=1 Tax=Fraxinus pennsylvanica TaxID=56036 RepID=A0AAD2DMW1_9LAMI|nr:unnamed protein product [Fraxinus pennsylvanica]